MANTPGQVVYSTSTRSPISVSSSSSSSSSSSPLVSSPRAAASLPPYALSSRQFEREWSTHVSRAGRSASWQRHDGSDGARFTPSRLAPSQSATTQPCALVYISPGTAHAFVALSGAVELVSTLGIHPQHRQGHRGKSHVAGTHKQTDSFSEEKRDATAAELTGGCWRLAHVVHSNTSADLLPGGAVVPFWCFTLEPLPEEQLELCQAALRRCGCVASSPNSSSTPLKDATRSGKGSPHSAPRRSPKREADPWNHSGSTLPPDVLVTPLYVCWQPAAIVEWEASLQLHRACASLTHAAAGWPVEGGLSPALHTLLCAAPSCATLVYALRVGGHTHLLPLLSLSDNMESGEGESEARCVEGSMREEVEAAAAAMGDVYLALAPPPSFMPMQRAMREGTVSPSGASESTASSPHGLSTLLRGIRQRCAHTRHQLVVFDGDGPASSQRCVDVLRALGNSEDSRGGVAEPCAVTRRLVAALRLAESVSSPSFIHGSRRYGDRAVLRVVDVLVQRQSADAGGVVPCELAVLGGRVRRLRQWAAQGGGCEEGFVPPSELSRSAKAEDVEGDDEAEPDIMTTPWMRAHCTQTYGPSSASAQQRKEGDTLNAAECTSVSTEAPTMDAIRAWLQAVDVSDAAQAHLDSLTHAIRLIASLRFIPQGLTSSSAAAAAGEEALCGADAKQHESRWHSAAALLAPASVPVCEAAAALLHLPALQLVQALTTVEVVGGGIESSTRRHALNCAGACHMQSVLVACFGGVLARTVMHYANRAIRPDAAHTCNSPVGRSVFSSPPSSACVVSLVTFTDCHAASNPLLSAGGTDSIGEQRGLHEWRSVLARERMARLLRERLVGTLQREARWEGVEREVDAWIDQAAKDVAESVPGWDSTWRDLRELAQRVGKPSLAAAHSGTRSSRTWRVAAAIDDCVEWLSGESAEASAVTQAVAVQQHLKDVLRDIVITPSASDTAVVGMVSNGNRGDDDGEGEGSVRWAPAAPTQQVDASAGESSASAMDSLIFSFPSGYHSPFQLSLSQLATDVLSVVRVRRMKKTAAVQAVVEAVRVRAHLEMQDSDQQKASLDGYPDKKDKAPTQRAQSPFPQQTHMGTAVAVQDSEEDSSSISNISSDTPSISLVFTLPAPAQKADAASSATRYPLLDSGVLALSPPSSLSPLGSPAVTVDDGILSYLRGEVPLLPALFLWSRRCHSRTCSAAQFGREMAVPLLMHAARSPPPPPNSAARVRQFQSPSHSLSAQFAGGGGDSQRRDRLARVRELQRRARYRELTLLAVSTVPVCRSVVLGVSRVFYSATAADAMHRCCVELRTAAVRELQRAGRGGLARRRLAASAVQKRSPAETRSVRVLTPQELRERAALEQAREAQLRDTAAALRRLTVATAEQYARAGSSLQRSWTVTLETLEAELKHAVDEVNHAETQRRAAEDAARQEARTAARVTEEAWAEVWADSARRLKDQRQQQRLRSGHTGAAGSRCGVFAGQEGAVPALTQSEANAQEEVRVAAVTTRHLSRLRQAAAEAAEAALLSRGVVAQQRIDTSVVAQQLRRQKQRLAREADRRSAEHDAANAGTLRAAGSDECWSRRHAGAEVSSATPVRSSAAAQQQQHTLQYSDARGLVFTRPRVVVGVPPHKQASRRARSSSAHRHAFREGGAGGMEGVDGSAMSIHHDATTLGNSAYYNASKKSAFSVGGDDDWEVQRDLMSLWESSRVTT